jgi:hypothetical protein
MENNGHHTQAFTFLRTLRKKDITILQSAVLLQALCGTYQTERITQQLAATLRTICTEEWIRTAPLATVFAVANALHFYDEQLITGRHIGVLAQRLIASEKAPGGPYADPSTEPDSFTNSLIAVFAGWAAGTLPGTNTYLQQHVTNGLNSSLVPSSILERYLAMVDGFNVSNSTQPNTATDIFTAAAMLWGYPIEPVAEPDTTALSATIFTTIAADIQKLDAPLATQAAAMLERIKRADKYHEITLLSQYFQEALVEHGTVDTLRLGVANVYCWLAYMAYDTMLDDARGIELLPLANIAQRKALFHYRHTVPQAESLVEMTFTRMDRANSWERTEARAETTKGNLVIATLPDYGNRHQLAARSYAHVLGPLLIAIEHGHQLQSKPLQALRTAFWHYLIARQLNDDAHDWQEDITNGQLTFVVTRLLQTHGTKHTVVLETALPDLQQLFRTTVSQEIATIMLEHCAKAKELFAQSELLTDSNMLYQLCENLENSAKQMASLSKGSEELLSTF